MARSSLYPPKGIVGPGLSLVAGSFTTANGADPSNVKGSGWKVSRAGEGQWDVTLTDAAVEIVCVTLGVAQNVLTKLSWVCEDADDRTTSVFRILGFISDDLTSPSFSADDIPGDEISFFVVCRDTSVADFATIV